MSMTTADEGTSLVKSFLDDCKACAPFFRSERKLDPSQDGAGRFGESGSEVQATQAIAAAKASTPNLSDSGGIWGVEKSRAVEGISSSSTARSQDQLTTFAAGLDINNMAGPATSGLETAVAGLRAFTWVKGLLALEAALFWSMFGYQYFSCTKMAQCSGLVSSMRSLQQMPRSMFWLTTSTVFAGTALTLANVTEKLLLFMAGFAEKLIRGQMQFRSRDQRQTGDAIANTNVAAPTMAAHNSMFPTLQTTTAASNWSPGTAVVEKEPLRNFLVDHGRMNVAPARDGPDNAMFKSNFGGQWISEPNPMFSSNPRGYLSPEKVNQAKDALKTPVAGMFDVTTRAAPNMLKAPLQTSWNSNVNAMNEPRFLQPGCGCNAQQVLHEAVQQEGLNFQKYIQEVKAFLQRPLQFPEGPEEVRRRRRNNRRSVSAIVQRQHSSENRNMAAVPGHLEHYQTRPAFLAPDILSRSESSVSEFSSTGSEDVAPYRR